MVPNSNDPSNWQSEAAQSNHPDHSAQPVQSRSSHFVLSEQETQRLITKNDNQTQLLEKIQEKKHKQALSQQAAAISVIIGIIIITTAIIFGVIVTKKNHEKQEFYNEMHAIVHSQECRKVMEEDFRELDPHALTDKGVIQTYEIVDSSIEHNPMGGIDFDTVINHDKKQTVGFTLNRRYMGGGYGPLESGGNVISGKLSARRLARYGKQIYDYDWASKYKKAHPDEFPPENNTQKKDE